MRGRSVSKPVIVTRTSGGSTRAYDLPISIVRPGSVNSANWEISLGGSRAYTFEVL